MVFGGGGGIPLGAHKCPSGRGKNSQLLRMGVSSIALRLFTCSVPLLSLGCPGLVSDGMLEQSGGE